VGLGSVISSGGIMSDLYNKLSYGFVGSVCHIEGGLWMGALDFSLIVGNGP